MMIYRAAEITKTVEGDNRTIEVVAATEDGVAVNGWHEYLQMSGVQLPADRQVPLLDTHRREGIGSIRGSARNLRVENNELLATVHFDKTAEMEFSKYKDGHATDFSVGLNYIERTPVPAGKTDIINGVSYTGPAIVHTKWILRELSMAPIGADESAKIRRTMQTFLTGGGGVMSDKKDDKKTMVRQWMEGEGLPVDADDATELEFMRNRSALDPERVERAANDERLRIVGINSLIDKYGDGSEPYSRLRAAAIDDGSSVDQVRLQVDKIFDRTPSGLDFHGVDVITHGEDSSDKFTRAARDGLLLRAGVDIKKPVPGATDLRGFSLQELCREKLRSTNQSVGGNFVKRAMSTDDFPALFANVANKTMLKTYQEREPNCWNFCTKGTVSNFLTQTGIRLSAFPEPREVKEGVPYKRISLSDGKEELYISSFGEIIPFTFQAMKNDSLRALTDTSVKIGNMFARLINTIGYAPLVNNPVMGDGVPLFHASHGNLATGADAAPPSLSTLTAGIEAMGGQTDISDNAEIDINPNQIIAPKTLFGTIAPLLTSTHFADSAADTTRDNYLKGYFDTITYSRKLTGDAWFLCDGKPIEIAFLDGVSTPKVEQKSGWDVDGMEWRVSMHLGSKCWDWLPIYKNPGA